MRFYRSDRAGSPDVCHCRESTWTGAVRELEPSALRRPQVIVRTSRTDREGGPTGHDPHEQARPTGLTWPAAGSSLRPANRAVRRGPDEEAARRALPALPQRLQHGVTCANAQGHVARGGDLPDRRRTGRRAIPRRPVRALTTARPPRPPAPYRASPSPLHWQEPPAFRRRRLLPTGANHSRVCPSGPE